MEDEFLPYTTKKEFIVVHFYHNDFLRCKIMDKHLNEIAKIHPECVFVSLNAQKVFIQNYFNSIFNFKVSIFRY